MSAPAALPIDDNAPMQSAEHWFLDAAVYASDGDMAGAIEAAEAAHRPHRR